LGNTAYELAGLDVEIEGNPFAPTSLLNQLRREAVEKLQFKQESTVTRPPVAQVAQASRPAHKLHASPTPNAALPPQLHLLVRTPAQLDAAIAFRPATITLDYLDLYGLRPSLDRIRAANLAPRIASPRVLKPGEERIADFLLSCECPILARSAGL